jgi:hypothetical protein
LSKSNSNPAPEATAEAPAPTPSGIQIETRFEIVDNTAAEVVAPRAAEESERKLDNGMTVVDYV